MHLGRQGKLTYAHLIFEKSMHICMHMHRIEVSYNQVLPYTLKIKLQTDITCCKPDSRLSIVFKKKPQSLLRNG